MNYLDTLRDVLDRLDSEMLWPLSRRFEIIRQIGEYKRKENISIEDLDREEEIKAKYRKDFSFPKGFTDELFDLIFRYGKKEMKKD